MAKKISISTPAVVKWLTLTCVADVCVALFQIKKPLPGSPDVTPVLAWYAKKLLDEVKEGIPHPLHKITLALQLTGDLDFE